MLILGRAPCCLQDILDSGIPKVLETCLEILLRVEMITILLDSVGFMEPGGHDFVPWHIIMLEVTITRK